MNNNFSEELKSQIDEILLKVDELNDPHAVLFCGNEIMKKVEKENNNINVNDYSSFIPAY